MSKILFLTNLLPFPLDNGGKIKTYNTLKALEELFEIDLFCFVDSEKDYNNITEMQKKFSNIKNINVLKKTLIKDSSKSKFLYDYTKSLFTLNPYNINKYFDKRAVSIIRKLISENKYEHIYIDHLPLMIYSKIIPGNISLILDQHNVESLIIKRYFTEQSNPIKKLLLWNEYKKIYRFEKRMLIEANKVIALSREDSSQFEAMGCEKSKISILPIHMDVKNIIYKFREKNRKISILFIGSMSWTPNQHGILWFLENVWPQLDKSIYTLYIVGGNPPERVKKFHNAKDIFVTGYVIDVDYYIEICDVSIVPLFVGSGQRVKIIESFGKGIPVISTSIGAEGLIYKDKNNIIIADDKNDFIKAFDFLIKDKSILEEVSLNARQVFDKHYSSALLPSKLKKALK